MLNKKVLTAILFFLSIFIFQNGYGKSFVVSLKKTELRQASSGIAAPSAHESINKIKLGLHSDIRGSQHRTLSFHHVKNNHKYTGSKFNYLTFFYSNFNYGLNALSRVNHINHLPFYISQRRLIL